jgi:hypothetical protein
VQEAKDGQPTDGKRESQIVNRLARDSARYKAEKQCSCEKEGGIAKRRGEKKIERDEKQGRRRNQEDWLVATAGPKGSGPSRWDVRRTA